jgi:hypothetical protein
MINIEEFISNQYSMLIAPAGYGKTHTISECLKKTAGKQLILTHTHAGVASLKEKVKKTGIESSQYNIETITSFAQKYVFAFSEVSAIPNQENPKEYYPFLITEATKLLCKRKLMSIVQKTYTGVFVDEYQDCNIAQHKLILNLAKCLPTRILGDHLQGIFDFDGTIIDLQNKEIMQTFYDNQYELNTPWRWKIGGNENLGINLKDIRNELEERKDIDLRKYIHIESKYIQKSFKEDIKIIRKSVFDIVKKESSLLILHPKSAFMQPRINLVQLFPNVKLIESIDDNSFYSLAKICDTITKENLELKIIELSLELFNKTGVKEWFNGNGLKNKRNDVDKVLTQKLKKLISQFSEQNKNIPEILKMVFKLPNIKCYRKEIYSSILNALIESGINKTTVYEAMTRNRNMNRRIGRKVSGKYIGTTLLTKGLEFDTVIIVDAHDFECPKHLYVALTRAAKRLIIYTNDYILKPYKK